MSWMDRFRAAGGTEHDAGPMSATVRGIVKELDALEPQEARFVAAFAYILGRAAASDLTIDEAEIRVMENLVGRLGHLPEELARLVVRIVKHRSSLFGATEDFVVTREFREISTVSQRVELLHCLFAVSAADRSISVAEEETIRRIATELGFGHAEYIEARSRYNALREVLRDLPGKRERADEGSGGGEA
ncbi:MAG: TerB family tellurite resistance protein [Candidatus Eisenbacteria bacterium]|nr:TerB family tellurite resistance protein [Candidatus Eisenbacteria bacterium]